MKETGIVRKVDELGRIVLPIELRRTLNINIKDPVEILSTTMPLFLKSTKIHVCSAAARQTS
jgi:transcriptional pleiotropic regulator of transition state genes